MAPGTGQDLQTLLRSRDLLSARIKLRADSVINSSLSKEEYFNFFLESLEASGLKSTKLIAGLTLSKGLIYLGQYFN